jgi:2-oxoisovalerate dehydrogenase E2 component (dihydrolipoyl transacylase)
VPSYQQFRLPDVGEGLTEGEILKWYVQPGDTVTVNQVIVEVETAKAAVELPSPYAGVVTELLVEEGATVDVGTPIITVDTDPGEKPAAQGEKPAAPVEAAPADQRPATADALRSDLSPEIPRPVEEPPERTPVLVGYGPRSTAARRRPRKAPAGSGPAGGAGTTPAAPSPPTPAAPPTLAKPPVRKLAKDLGVDLAGLVGTGPNGVITRADVEAAAAPGPVASTVAEPAEPRPSAGEREQRIPIKGVRKHTAAAMVASAFTAPHVTEFVAVDVTPMMELRRTVAALPEFDGIKVSPLLFVAKALLLAVHRHPMINSSWDEEAQEIVVKEYVNLGIAAATDRGLIVPNVKDAGRLPLRELAVEIGKLTDTARAGRTSPGDMTGGTITITNVGVFGVDSGTPILNPGESAILAVGAIREMPWVVDGELAVRQVSQLALSFDHRVVDGQLGSEFLADIAAMLSNPAQMLAWS